MPAVARRPWRTNAWGMRAAGVFGLLLLIGLSIAIVIGAAERASFLAPPSLSPALHGHIPAWMAGPLHHLWGSLSHNRGTLKWDFSLAVIGMYLAYLLVLLCVPFLRARWLIASIVVLHVVFFLAPPLPLTDVFNYLNYGRMGFIHHLNPYATIPMLEPHSDPAFAVSNWHHLLSPYGQLFTLFTYLLAPLGVSAGFWVLKASLALASLSALLLVWRCAQLLGRDPVLPVAFVGLNPLVMVWGLGGDHNDFFMILLMVFAFYLLLRVEAGRGTIGIRPRPARRPALAVSPGRSRIPSGGNGANGAGARIGEMFGRARALPGAVRRGDGRAASALTRWPPPAEALAGAALVSAIAIKASAGLLLPILFFGTRRRRPLLIGALAGAVVLALVSLIAFGPHLPNLSDQSKVVTNVGLPNLLGFALGYGGVTTGLQSFFSGVLVLTVVACSVWAYRARDWLLPAGVAMLVLLMTLSWELPWYVFWLLPLAALARRRFLRAAALVMGAYLILAWMPLVTDLLSGLKFRPTATPLGEAHARQSKKLLH
ncbi:MAG: hypothetical protein E6G56_00025 [Actinobacteria bacterium]|nr:MAG: hypothetical protein E6G56_00025 [Actinomycetota bacterium]